jgi:Abortive infection alpha
MTNSPQPDPSPSRNLAGRAAESGLFRAASGLARVYASAWLRTAEWAVESSVRTSARLMSAAAGAPATEMIEEAMGDVREYASGLLRIADGGSAELRARSRRRGRPAGELEPETLRERGAELLRRSADIHYREESHPAYERILDALAPDEARILRLLATRGPQPAVDVRTGIPHVRIASALVAPGLTMIAAEAGCRYPERIKPYLNNLYRLGLIWFSREPVRDSLRYQVVEAQAEVTEAMRRAGRLGHTVRRSIVLTPFGRDFCELCLPLEPAPEPLPADVATEED